MIFLAKPMFSWTGNRMKTLRKPFDQQGCQIYGTGLPDFMFFGVFLQIWLNLIHKDNYSGQTHILYNKEYKWNQLNSFKNIGLPDLYYRVATFTDFTSFESFLHIFGSNWLSKVIFLAKPMFSWTRNRMKTLRKLYDQQGCQICTTGLPNLQILPPFESFLHNFGSNWLSKVIFLAKPMFSWTRNLMKTLRKLYDQQGCQICTTGLPNLQILPPFESFLHNFGSNWLSKVIFLAKPMFSWTRNLLKTLRKLLDQQVCQIYTTGLPDSQILPHFKSFPHNFGSNGLSQVIFLAKAMF